MSFSEDVGIPMPPDGNYWKERALQAEAAHLASFSALQRISELTRLEGEVDNYDDVVNAVSMLAEGRIGSLIGFAAGGKVGVVMDGMTFVIEQTREGGPITITNMNNEHDWIVVSVKEQYRDQRKKLHVAGKGWSGFNP